jgi:hypothetical protein
MTTLAKDRSTFVHESMPALSIVTKPVLFTISQATMHIHKPVPTFAPSPLAPLLEKIPIMPKLM